MSQQKMPVSLYDHLKRNAPATFEALYRFDERTPQICYLLAQAMQYYVNQDRKNLLQPLSTFREVKDGDIEGLCITNKAARVFVGEGATFVNSKIAGETPAYYFFGAGSQIIKSTFSGKAQVNFFAVGFGCRLEGLLAHTLSQLGAMILCPGVTTHNGCNFFTQENAYILLGDDCMLSTNIYLRTSDSHGIYARNERARINKAAPIIFHPHVWISRAVNINKGVEIGSDSVIGQGAIVSGAVHANCVYAGIPAKKIKSDIFWDRAFASKLGDDFTHDKSHFVPSFRTHRDTPFQAHECETADAFNRLSRQLYTDSVSFAAFSKEKAEDSAVLQNIISLAELAQALREPTLKRLAA